MKALGSTLVKDHQALDTRVTEYAMKNNIVLSGGTLTTETYTRSDRTAGTTAHNDMGGTPSGGTPSSSPNDRMGAESPALTGSTAYPQEGEVDRMATREEKMNALRSLRGTDFDREFLSRVVEKGNTWISVLQERRGKFDKTIDGEITKTIDAVKRHVSEAQRLSSSLRAT